MKIELASIENLHLIVPLFDAYMVFYGQPSAPDKYARYLKLRLERKEAIVLLASDRDGDASGFTLLYPSFSSVSQARIFILNDLYVHKSHRRKGIARALMDAAAEYGRTHKAVRLHLETDHHNINAQQLYESSGWTKDSTHHYFLKL